jgi:hypothetical protein
VYLGHHGGFQAAVETSCDGLDNDCDGSTDEDFTLTLADGSQVAGTGQSCGVGACAGGTTACTTLQDGLRCSSDGLGSTEVCDDQIDNDCDGKSDCGDADCAGKAGCVQSCGPSNQVKCGDYWDGWSGTGPKVAGSSNMTAYNCANVDFPGTEQVFAFTPESDGTILFGAIANETGKVGMLLLEGSCNAASCVKVKSPIDWVWGSLSATVKGGTPYYLVVDSTVAGRIRIHEWFLSCTKL